MLTKNCIIFIQIQLPKPPLFFSTFPLWILLEDRCMGLHLSTVMGISFKITLTLLHQKCSIMIVLYELLWQRANAQNINFVAANLHYQLSWWNQIIS